MTERLVFIAPGYPHSVEEANYREVQSIYSENDFDVEPLDIDWGPDFWENLEQFEDMIDQELEKRDSPEIHFFGHSWGASILLTLSSNYDPETQILAGLSPEFEEDEQTFSRFQKTVAPLMTKLVGLFYEIPDNLESRPSYRSIRDEVESEFYLFYGEREYEGFVGLNYLGMKGKLTEQRKEILGAEEVIVPRATHMMESDTFFNEIERVVSGL